MPCATRAAMPSWWNAWPRCAPTTDAIRRASQKHGGCLRCRRPYSDFQTAGENPMSDEDIHAAGMKVRRRILGDAQIGRASCRERVCQYVNIPGDAGTLTTNNEKQDTDQRQNLTKTK